MSDEEAPKPVPVLLGVITWALTLTFGALTLWLAIDHGRASPLPGAVIVFVIICFWVFLIATCLAGCLYVCNPGRHKNDDEVVSKRKQSGYHLSKSGNVYKVTTTFSTTQRECRIGLVVLPMVAVFAVTLWATIAWAQRTPIQFSSNYLGSSSFSRYAWVEYAAFSSRSICSTTAKDSSARHIGLQDHQVRLLS